MSGTFSAWRTVAPIVSRTDTQSLNHYQMLQDEGDRRRLLGYLFYFLRPTTNSSTLRQTVAPFVSRTSIQCLDHYQMLLGEGARRRPL